MGKPNYSGITSLDGYVADAHGAFDWAVPDEEAAPAVRDVAGPWRTTDKVVYSTTPESVWTARTRLELLEERRFGNGMVHLRPRAAA
ncbi:hypothetical protein [Streptomyces sp. NPDC018045]|uniref:hypothetical protein n=1 Tax=Streptomyces sp. NPDC018045 TaxID=3365037 RepID=UPI00378A227F